MKDTTHSKPNVWYPPGGILIWIIILVEVFTFFMGIGALVVEKSSNLVDFQSMQSQLNMGYGVAYTIFLITSGYFMALAISFFQEKKDVQLKYSLLAAIGFGLLFLILKAWEYSEKISLGFNIHSSTFWGYYWFLTGFHFLHVVVGIIILSILYVSRKTVSLDSLEAGASFWHMCDLVWIVLLPILYLIR